MCGFCDVWICVCVGFVICGCFVMFGCVCVGFLMCGCFDICAVFWIICILVITVFLSFRLCIFILICY